MHGRERRFRLFCALVVTVMRVAGLSLWKPPTSWQDRFPLAPWMREMRRPPPLGTEDTLPRSYPTLVCVVVTGGVTFCHFYVKFLRGEGRPTEAKRFDLERNLRFALPPKAGPQGHATGYLRHVSRARGKTLHF